MKRSATKLIDVRLPTDVARRLNGMIKGTRITLDQLITAIIVTHIVMMREVMRLEQNAQRARRTHIRKRAKENNP